MNKVYCYCCYRYCYRYCYWYIPFCVLARWMASATRRRVSWCVNTWMTVDSTAPTTTPGATSRTSPTSPPSTPTPPPPRPNPATACSDILPSSAVRTQGRYPPTPNPDSALVLCHLWLSVGDQELQIKNNDNDDDNNDDDDDDFRDKEPQIKNF